MPLLLLLPQTLALAASASPDAPDQTLLPPLDPLDPLAGGGFGDESWDEYEDDVVFPDEIKTPEDAKKTIAGIREVSKRLATLHDDHENVKQAAADLEKAVKVLQGAEFEGRGSAVVGADARNLKKYIVPDEGGGGDKVRLLGGETEFSFAGRTYRTHTPGLLDDPEMACEWQAELKRLVSQRNLARLSQKSPNTPGMDARIALHMTRCPNTELKRAAENAIKALGSDNKQRAFSNSSSSGAEWIPETFIPELYEAMQVRGEIRGQFDEVTITSDSFKRPRVSNVTRPYILGQITSDNPSNFTASTPTTGEQSYTVPGLAVRTLADVAATEDSAIAAAARIGRMLIDSLADGIRDATINGDTTATHEDTIASWNIRSRWGSFGLGGAADHRRAWKGLRRQAVDRSVTLDMGSLQTAAGILQLLAMMGERAAGGIKMFTSPEVMIKKLMALSEVITVDKFGPRATVITGQLADIFGMPIIPTRFVSADLNASGLYDNTTMTKSGIILVDTSGYNFISRRAEMVETQKVIASQHLEIVSTVRLGFDSPDDSSAKNVAFGFNWL